MKGEIYFKETVWYKVPLDELPDNILSDLTDAVLKNIIQCYHDLTNFLAEYDELTDIRLTGNYDEETAQVMTMKDNNGEPTAEISISDGKMFTLTLSNTPVEKNS